MKRLIANCFPRRGVGFTLIELLIVIAILGILAMIGLGSYQASLRKGRDARRTGDLKGIQNALEQYYAENGNYPGLSYPNGIGAYMPQGVPTDPRTGNSYCTFIYTNTNYIIYTDLETEGSWVSSCTNNDFSVSALQ